MTRPLRIDDRNHRLTRRLIFFAAQASGATRYTRPVTRWTMRLPSDSV
jgi:hypothetical protein